MTNEPTETLTDDEAVSVLAWMITEVISGKDWLHWGDIPELSEESFNRLRDGADAAAQAMRDQAIANDQATGINGRAVWERLQ